MKTFLAFTICLFSFAINAQEIHGVAGMRSDTAEARTSGLDTEGKAGFQAGAIGYYDINEILTARSGLLFSQRRYDIDAGSRTVGEPRLSYLEVPVSAMYNINDFLGAFAGLNIGLNIAKSCDGSVNCDGLNTMPIAAQLGGAFELADRLGLELYYEHGISKIADEIENPRVLVGQLMYAF